MAAATADRDSPGTAAQAHRQHVAAVTSALSWWPAPAKLNLFLHVVGRRADGYHELQTLFQLIDLSDSVGLALREDGMIERVAGMPDLPPERDLAVRAAQALQRHTGVRLGADLHVIKHIPAGGGLGGGSSDAATVLLGLNRLWGAGLALDELSRLGLGLGADVPLFVYGASAWGEGRGARLVGCANRGARCAPECAPHGYRRVYLRQFRVRAGRAAYRAASSGRLEQFRGLPAGAARPRPPGPAWQADKLGRA